MTGKTAFLRSEISGIQNIGIDTWAKGLLVFMILAWAATPVLGFVNTLTLITLVALGLACVGIFKPSLGLLAIGILVVLDPISRPFAFSINGLPWSTFSYFLSAIIFFNLPVMFRYLNIHTILLAFLIFVMGIYMLISQDVTNGILNLWGVCIAFGLLFFTVRSYEQDSFYWLGIVCGVTAALTSFVYLLVDQDLPFFNKNTLAYIPLSGMFMICLGIHDLKQLTRQSLLIILTAINFAFVFLSNSRGAILIALPCLIYIAVSVRRLDAIGFFTITSLTIILIVFTQFSELYDKTLYNIDKTLNSQISIEERSNARSDLLIGGWHLFLDNPLGYGTGSFAGAWYKSNAIDPYITSWLLNYEHNAAHAGWLKVLVENGIVGFTLMFLYVFSFTFVGIQKPELLKLGLLTTAVLAIAFISTEFQNKSLWFLAAGTTVIFQQKNSAE